MINKEICYFSRRTSGKGSSNNRTRKIVNRDHYPSMTERGVWQGILKGKHPTVRKVGGVAEGAVKSQPDKITRDRRDRAPSEE